MKKKPIITTPLHPLPVSKGHWLLRNLPNMGKNILTHFYNKEKELGHTYENPIPFMRIIATSEPDFMRYVLQSNHHNYKKGQPYEVLKFVLGNGLVTSNGKFWQKQRRLAQPAFHKKNLGQVIEDSMRLYPPVWSVSRTALAKDEYRGVKINKNDIVFCMIYNTHHREDLYENANTFNPDRFSSEKLKAMPKMRYLPFGGGSRRCIGNMFALMEMKLILVGLLQRFDFELVANQQIEMEAMITLRPRDGIKMNLK